MTRREFPGLSPRAYEHPADRAALVALRRVPGFDLVVRKLFGGIGDRSLRLAFLASSVRVSEKQFPDVHASFVQACKVLDVDPIPELYVAQTPIVNAGAVVVDHPFIVINSDGKMVGARSITRKPESERWDPDALARIQVVPGTGYEQRQRGQVRFQDGAIDSRPLTSSME